MRVLRTLVTVTTGVALLAQTSGLAFAAPPAPEPLPRLPDAATQAVVVAAPAPGIAAASPVGTPPGYAPIGPDSDTVILRDGGVLHGTLIELVANDHATLRLSTGQAVMVEWAKLDHIERAVAGQAQQPAPVVRADGASAFVHLESDEAVALEARSGDRAWTFVCGSPCDAPVPLAGEYRIAGSGVRASSPFRIEAAPGARVVINVAAASKAGFAGGVVLTSVGGAAIPIGLLVWVVGSICNGGDGGPCASNGAQTAGEVILVAGIAGVIGGIILIASNAHTRASQTFGDLLPQPPSRPDTAWLRAPVWHDGAAGSSPVALPRPTTLPILSRSF